MWRGVHPEGIHPEGETGGEVLKILTTINFSTSL
jgi:hypothetical protein